MAKQAEETKKKSNNPLFKKDYNLKDNRLFIEGFGTVEKYPAGTTEKQIKEKSVNPLTVPREALEALEQVSLKAKKNPEFTFKKYLDEAITEEVEEDLN